MLNAEILGVQEKSSGVNEKPSIYESVIKTHRTSIQRPKFGKGNPIGLNVSEESMRQFLPQNEAGRLGQGHISIPVKIQNTAFQLNDPTMSKYNDIPLFLSTKSETDKKGPRTLNVPKMPMITPDLQATSAKDVKMIKSKLDSAKSKKQKLKACIVYFLKLFSKIQQKYFKETSEGNMPSNQK